MKFVIILLLTTGGLEQIKYPIESGLTCEGQAHRWRDANVTYYDSRNTGHHTTTRVGIQRRVIYGLDISAKAKR